MDDTDDLRDAFVTSVAYALMDGRTIDELLREGVDQTMLDAAMEYLDIIIENAL